MQENKVKISDLMNNRFDPFFYDEKFQSLLKDLLKVKFISKIGSLIESWNRGDGPREGFYTEDKENGIPFIRINNLKNHSVNLTDIKYIHKNIHNTKLKRTKVKAKDLIFAISGTKENLGTIAIIPDNIKEANLNSALVRLDLDNSKILDRYFCVLFDLNFVRTQINYIGKGAAQNNLNNEEISQILIPVPNKDFQSNIIKLLDDAYDTKLDKEKKSQDLMDSCEKKLLEVLNIQIPNKKNESNYKLLISNLWSKRIDVKYHQPKYQELEKCIKYNDKKIYSLESLDNICEEVISGQRPKGGVSQITQGIPSIGGEHVFKDGTIAIENLKYIPEDFHQNQLKSRIKPLDIILVKDGATTGKVGIIPENYPFKEANINEHVFILRCKNNINPYYLLTFLMSEIGQIQIEREVSGATIMGITKDSLKNILIPVPNDSIQNSISHEYKKCLELAEQLKREANSEYEKAKERVENIILGKENL